MGGYLSRLWLLNVFNHDQIDGQAHGSHTRPRSFYIFGVDVTA